MTTRKALTDDEQRKVAEALRKYIRETFDGNQSALVRAHPTLAKQSHISKILRGETPAGYGFARKLAGVLKINLPDLIGSGSAKPLGPRWCDLKGWPSASMEAQRFEPSLSEQIAYLGTLYAPDELVTIDVDAIVSQALWLRRHIPRWVKK